MGTGRTRSQILLAAMDRPIAQRKTRILLANGTEIRNVSEFEVSDGMPLETNRIKITLHNVRFVRLSEPPKRKAR